MNLMIGLRSFKTSIRETIRRTLQYPLSGSLLRKILSRKKIQVTPHSQPFFAISNLIPFLGDVILYFPLVDALREKWPNARIVYVGDTAVRQILNAYPGIDEVISYRGISSRRWVKRIPIFRSYVQLVTTVAFFSKVRLERMPDLALVPRGGPDPCLSAHAAWLLNIPRIYGSSCHLEPEREYIQRGSDALMTAMVREIRHSHESMRALDVAEVAGLLPPGAWCSRQAIRGLQVLAAAQNFEEIENIAGLHPGERRYAIISPGAGAANRKWPTNFFREIAIRLRDQASISVIVTGTQDEYALGDALSKGLGDGVRNLTGKLNLLQLISLIGRATLFLGNDSGSGHIAGGLGVPTVSLNAYPAAAAVDHHQSPTRNRPIGPRVSILQPKEFLAPCTDECRSQTVHCLAQIKVDEVWDAILKLLPPAD